MLFFTISSRSILYFLMPKVSVSGVDSGTLSEKRSFDNIQVSYSDIETIHIPYHISTSLHIEHILKREGDIVQSGEPIIQFNMLDYNLYLTELTNEMSLLKSEYNSALQKQQYIEEQYLLDSEALNYKAEQLVVPSEDNMDLQQIKIEIATKERLYNSTLKEYELSQELYDIGTLSKQDLASISESLITLEEEIHFLNLKYENTLSTLQKEYDKALNSIRQEKAALLLSKESSLAELSNLDELNLKYKKLETQYTVLTSLIKDGQLIAPCDGTISTHYFKEGATYSGYDTLVAITPMDSDINYTVDVSTENQTFLDNIQTGSLLLSDASIDIEDILITESTNSENEKIKTLTFKTVEDLSSEQQNQIKSLTLESKSTYYDVLVPINAIIDDSYVFILTEEDNGIWGTYYYVHQVNVKTDAYNTSDIAIISGLSQNQRIVISWDRTLSDNQRVILDES